eukprot:GGOE01005995.1.p1 GENE.GGOE01005995.1~~GGOE01005995.1.p1  ORF type:complete len:884 (+),score=114.56 GGOE01005995.1:32-2653(+)
MVNSQVTHEQPEGGEGPTAEEGRKRRHRRKDCATLNPSPEAAAEEEVRHTHRRPRSIDVDAEAATSCATPAKSVVHCDPAGNVIAGGRSHQKQKREHAALLELPEEHTPRHKFRRHNPGATLGAETPSPLAVTPVQGEEECDAAGNLVGRRSQRKRQREDLLRTPQPQAHAVEESLPTCLFATPVKEGEDVAPQRGSGRKGRRKQPGEDEAAMDPLPPPPDTEIPVEETPSSRRSTHTCRRTNTETEAGMELSSCVTPAKTTAEEDGPPDERRRTFRKHRRVEPESPQHTEAPPVDPTPWPSTPVPPLPCPAPVPRSERRSHRKRREEDCGSPELLEGPPAEPTPRRSSRKHRPTEVDADVNTEADFLCVTPAKVTTEFELTGDKKRGSHRKRRGEDSESPQLLDVPMSEETPQRSAVVPEPVTSAEGQHGDSCAPTPRSGKQAGKRRDAEPSLRLLDCLEADEVQPRHGREMTTDGTTTAEERGEARKRFRSRGEMLASLVPKSSAGAAGTLCRGHGAAPASKSPVGSPPPPAADSPQKAGATSGPLPAPSVGTPRSPRKPSTGPAASVNLQPRVQNLSPDAAVLFRLFKSLSVLIVQPRNRLLSRLRPALEAACGDAVLEGRLFQVAAVAPDFLEVSHVKVEGALDTHIKPLQMFNRLEHRSAFVDALEKVDLASVRREAAERVAASVASLSSNSAALGERPPTVPVFREAHQLYTERSRPVTQPTEIAALLQQPMPEKLSFLTRSKQVKVRQAERIDKEMAQAHLQDRLRKQQLVCHLPRLVDIIRATFQPKHIRTMGWDVLVTLLHSCHPQRQQLRPQDIDAMLALLVEAAPQWCDRQSGTPTELPLILELRTQCLNTRSIYFLCASNS